MLYVFQEWSAPNPMYGCGSMKGIHRSTAGSVNLVYLCKKVSNVIVKKKEAIWQNIYEETDLI